MPEYLFKMPQGAEFKIVGDRLRETTIDSLEGKVSQYGKTKVAIYETQRRGFLATVEYQPGMANHMKLAAWATFIPEMNRPNMNSLDELKIEFETVLHLGTFPNLVIEAQVKEAITVLFPPAGPTVID